ncbi:MAG TPA: ABC transporter substrate-binding protein, partial [Stellaceae bacterium]|nr:ABC transporter substrate-binding protein [Stellaceae bacterium]
MAVSVLAGILLLAVADVSARAEGKKLVFGLPPIFASTVAVVADREGFFRKRGVDVEVKFFDASAPRAAALVSGDIDFNLASTPLTIRQASNADVDLVALYGMPFGDFLIASTDPALTTCTDLKGQQIGVDAVGGTRALALQDMLSPCGLKLDDVEQVALTGNANSQAMIAGRIRVAVLHTEEVGVIAEKGGRPVRVITTFSKAKPDSHYLVIVVRRDSLEANRDAYTRVMAALIDAVHFMNENANADRVAEAIYPIGLSGAEAKAALLGYLEIGFWPVDGDG